MKQFIIGCLLLMTSMLVLAQNTNPTSIYEGYIIQHVDFSLNGLPTDTVLANSYRKAVESEFSIGQHSQYSAIMASYYTSKIDLLPFVEKSTLEVFPTVESGVKITVNVTFRSKEEQVRSQTDLKSKHQLPVLYNSRRAYLTMRVAASEMVYSNHNTWFGDPASMTAGNPLANSPTGDGWSAWLEGFASVGTYGVVKLTPKANLHLYGGASYLVSFSAGNELFSNKARIYAAVEDAFVGVVGGKQTSNGDHYKYNVTYGRKSFIMADGWLINNTSMNGYNRAALQLNPRWAARELLLGGFSWNRLMAQVFSVTPNDLDIINSETVINGINLEASNRTNGTLGFAYLSVPKSKFRYYSPDGTVYTRQGLQVYNLRLYKNSGLDGGVFLKSEVGYQTNKNFDMSSWAYYGELGWHFAKVKGSPAISYRYAHFGGDNPNSKSYNRWDALYTGGNGEQWVQGSVMFKIAQNSNEITHRIQAVYRPALKFQMVGQIWLFYADQLNNIGGNPALSTLKSKFYGTEYNFTLKYFYSRQWYFYMNTAYALPGSGIRENLSSSAKDWFCATVFARYSF
ncbi:hypothetical protein G7051_03395 [Dysgonomonas sp. HDW5B]|uniref:alginate export family protein n=1 Tax=Dysgonomonas sp. HDW5B TaxID=2714927 RepID=UPI00140C0B30|nr:alginate export family protein [Dysgonomonas sp. HDW5B]QIK53442.1 hypothetical protein G7051_03395 [Dysgonomonas sp. HDW5B]